MAAAKEATLGDLGESFDRGFKAITANIAELRNDLATNAAKLDARRRAALFLKDLFTVKREY